MITFQQFLDFIRSVSFGALVVNTLLLIAFSYFPYAFPENFTYKEILYIGSAIGTILHRAFNSILFNPLTKEFARSSAFYAKLKEAKIARRAGVLTEEEFLEYTKDLKRDYFSSASAKGLPPAVASMPLQERAVLRLPDQPDVYAKKDNALQSEMLVAARHASLPEHAKMKAAPSQKKRLRRPKESTKGNDSAEIAEPATERNSAEGESYS